MMEESIENRGGEDLIVEDLAPVDEALVAGDDQTAAFVAAHEQPKEETGFFPR